ncbi:MAG: hypothetical protein VX519_10590 [Myxococcota bacterium]|nr:hypothetical protein [Myxococcota bacterium]
MRSLIQEGEQARVESNFDKAIELCWRAVELGLGRVQLREIRMAEECIHKARVGRRNLARSFFAEGHAQRRQEQLLQARAAFAEALRIDPDYSAAKSVFLEVQQQLLEQAKEAFERAVVLEKSRNLEPAIAHLKQVQELVGDPNDPLYKKAENRLRDLAGD